MLKVFFGVLLMFSASAWAWYSDDKEDPISGKRIYGVYAKSVNSHDFGFPHGVVRARLVIQRHPQFGRRAVIAMTAGQVDCIGSQLCELLIRFDNGPARQFKGYLPSDGSLNTLLIKPLPGLLSGLKNARKAYVAVQFYRGGISVFEFDVRDFDEAMLKAVKGGS